MDKDECYKCTYWHKFDKYSGDCRRYPPQRVGEMSSKFPRTSGGEWCGEFKAKTKAKDE